MLLACSPAPSRIWAAEQLAPPNFLPQLVVAVLPFENATGEAAWDDWRQALPALIRSCLGEVEFVSAPGWRKVQQSLVRAGWTATNAVDAALARQLARDLRAHGAVWGQVRRTSNGWAVDARLLRMGSEMGAEQIQATAAGWVDLAESVSLRVAKQLGRRLADDDREFWRMNMPHNDEAANGFAKAICLMISGAPVARQEAACREVLAADPRCGGAHSWLFETLLDPSRQADCKQAIEVFLQQQPRSCRAHLAHAVLSLAAGNQAGTEAEVMEALRLHRGCPDATRLLFRQLAPAGRWADLVSILKQALANRPDAEVTRIFLANALTQSGDRKEGRAVFAPIGDLPDWPEGSTIEEWAFFQTACAVGREDLAGLAVLQFSSQAQTNSLIRKCLEAPVAVCSEEFGSNAPLVRPRSFTPAALSAELERRLTAEERPLVVNPVEVTPAVRAEARRLTAYVTNEWLKALALFAEVARRGRGAGDGGQRTAAETLKDSADPETRLSCQEHAKLFVAFARALGLEAWIAHIERCADGSPGYHDCAALFLEGHSLLVDPTWGVFDIRHQEFTVLDDLQAISHQAMQPGLKGDPRRLRMGLKLNPEDRWTSLQFVRGMARAGELDAATEEWRRVQSTGTETWDVHDAAAELEAARQRWKPALAEWQRALALSPSNAVVHFNLALVYSELADLANSKSHLQTALRLNRGEFSRELRQHSQSHMAFLTAVSQGQSGGPAERESLQRRAEAGECAAQKALAKVCLDERPPRIEEGMRWLLMAANSEDDSAMFDYARNRLVLGGADAAKEAVAWLAKAANRGNVAAQYRLGLILYEGKLVRRDNVGAGQWVYLAADQGHVEARRLLKEMEFMLEAGELAEARKRAEGFKPFKKATGTP